LESSSFIISIKEKELVINTKKKRKRKEAPEQIKETINGMAPLERTFQRSNRQDNNKSVKTPSFSALIN